LTGCRIVLTGRGAVASKFPYIVAVCTHSAAASRAQSQMFKDQAGDRTAAAKASICLRLAMRRLDVVSGQQNLDDGIRSRRELGTPAMGLDNLSDDRQAQAAAI
jgi:hypothetical protein